MYADKSALLMHSMYNFIELFSFLQKVLCVPIRGIMTTPHGPLRHSHGLRKREGDIQLYCLWTRSSFRKPRRRFRILDGVTIRKTCHNHPGNCCLQQSRWGNKAQKVNKVTSRQEKAYTRPSAIYATSQYILLHVAGGRRRVSFFLPAGYFDYFLNLDGLVWLL